MSVVCLPLLCVAWAAALLLGSEAGARRDALSAALAAAVALHAAAAALGHTALNVRVRDNLKRSVRAGPRAAGCGQRGGRDIHITYSSTASAALEDTYNSRLGSPSHQC